MNAPPVPAERPLVQRALAGHAAIGLLVGALLYIVLLTGSLSVVHERLLRWENVDAPRVEALSPIKVQRALAQAWHAPGKSPSKTLYIALPNAASGRAVVYNDDGAHLLDQDGAIAAEAANPWTEFLLALHEHLNLPATFGLILVGLLGVMMAALSITGIVAHPRIARDAFLLRARGHRQLAQADWHNRIGTWTLPFALAIALTGAFFGLGSVGAGLIARVYHGGDVSRVYSPVFGDFVGHDPRPAPLADVATALRTMHNRFPDAEPGFVTVVGPGTKGQRVIVLAEMPRRLIYGENFLFDAAGTYHGTVGLSDGRLGQQAAASAYKLHFGDFGGWPVELLYLALGLAVTAIAGTGMSLWLQKRHKKGHDCARLEAFWSVIVWGTPMLLALAYWGTRILPAALTPVLTFWSGLALAVAAGLIWPAALERARTRRTAATTMVATGIAHALMMDVELTALTIDAALVGIGTLTWLPRAPVRHRHPTHAMV